MTFQVLVDDNFHYMDEEARAALGRYDAGCAALTACRRLVDEWLVDQHRPGMSAGELLLRYQQFGPDPFIVSEAGHAEAPEFSAWDYARQQASALVAAQGRV